MDSVTGTLADEGSIEVLLVEDNPGDVDLAREAFRTAPVVPRLRAVANGREALCSLRGQEPYDEAHIPDLILLDLNMPILGGRETLAEIKADPDLATIPVVVLTTSENDDDVIHCYELGASAYLTKPTVFDEYVDLIRVLSEFWLDAVRYPPKR